MTYRRGDFWRIDDITGTKVRASQTVRQWDGLITTDPDERNPQDFVRGRKDNQNVPDPRPEGVDTFLGPLATATTADASAGATSLTVESSVRFEGGDDISVMLSSGEIARLQLNDVPDSSTLTLSSGLPGSVSSGALVVNYDAVAEAAID